MVEPEFCFFEVKIKRMFCNPVELTQTSFGVAPEAFNAVDMRTGFGEFVVGMVNAKMLGIAHIHEPIVAGPAVRMDDAIEGDAAANRFAQSVFRYIGDDLGVDAVAPLEHAEDDGVLCPAPRPRLPRTRRGPK